MDKVIRFLFRHTKLRKEVLNIANIPAISDVKPDYKIVGKIRV